MYIEHEYQDNALILFQGPVTVNLISYMGNYIQSFLDHKAKFLQQVFRIFVELTQNVSYYSADTQKSRNVIDCGKGWFSLQDLTGYYKLTTGNLIKSDDGPKLTVYCNEINSLPHEELRKLKREVQSKALMQDVSARVGMIQISLASQNKLDFRIEEVNKTHSFFILSAYLNKSQKFRSEILPV
ncbi:MAG: SiaB family protein kinase [Bacteroidales bacterium]|nr:SiaB family protein kinase [Bacteroidales bacterium]